MSGACPADCGRPVRIGHLLCGPCWSLVPRSLQRGVLTTWSALLGARRRHGAGSDQAGEATAAYDVARDAAITAIVGDPVEEVTALTESHRHTLAAAAEHHPHDYRVMTGHDPRWAQVRGRIGPMTDDGHRLIELAVLWLGETYSLRYMWRPNDPNHPRLRAALDHMVTELDQLIPEVSGG